MMAEVFRAFFRILGVVRFEGQVVKGFENSVPAFGRSYIAFFLAMPMYMYSVYVVAPLLGQHFNLSALIVALLLHHAIEWLLWPNILLPMVKMLGARQYFCRYMIAYNWLNLVLVLVTIPLQASSQNGMTGGVALMGMVVLVLSLVWNWQIARHALEISKQYAVGITITNFMMKLVLGMMMTMHLFSGVQM